MDTPWELFPNYREVPQHLLEAAAEKAAQEEGADEKKWGGFLRDLLTLINLFLLESVSGSRLDSRQTW